MIARWLLSCSIALIVALAMLAPSPSASQTHRHTKGVQATATPFAIPSPDQLMFLIRRQFRSHRPPPPYEVYTLTRSQMTDYGYPDPVNSYSWHVWCRTYDDACLEREEFRLGAHGQMTFKRPRFNVADDPGPPTADVFERAPTRQLTAADVPTPEPTGALPQTIATVMVLGEFDYRVQSATMENGLIHVILTPRRDPERNRLREMFVDPKSYELQSIITHDRLFVDGDKDSPYPVTFTITMGNVNGYPVMTHVYGVVGGGYSGDGQTVDFGFKDISFPSSLPAWYFNPGTYSSHLNDAPL